VEGGGGGIAGRDLEEAPTQSEGAILEDVEVARLETSRKPTKAKTTQVWTRKMRNAATTKTALPLITRFCLMSNRAQQESLSGLVNQLASYARKSSYLAPSFSTNSRLAYFVHGVEAAVLHAKTADLLRMLAQMALTLELD
jgi:hypothetical protein